MKSFSTLKLDQAMIENLERLSYKTMTPVQEATLPAIIERRDLLAQAKTGSGKTAAFGIGIMHNLDFSRYRIQCLVLCPTRELADQVSTELRRLARFRHNIKVLTITGGLPQYRQELSLKHLAHIVVGTPGRLLKVLKRGAFDPDNITMAVLDEADRMLDMGFIDEVSEIFSFLPKKRQTLCFSATFPEDVLSLTDRILNEPEVIRLESGEKENDIEHRFYSVTKNEKKDALCALLNSYLPDSSIVFCNTKEGCRQLERELVDCGIHAISLHGDLEQKDRNEVLVRFSNGSSRILIATDVAARGLDIPALAAVFNYDFPLDAETYVHRAGRTGRAGERGHAFTFVSGREKDKLAGLNSYLKKEYACIEVPATNAENLFPQADMVTVSINGGRKNKISPGDLLGALTATGEITGDMIGKIDRQDFITFVAVKRDIMPTAVSILRKGTIKGKQFKVRVHN